MRSWEREEGPLADTGRDKAHSPVGGEIGGGGEAWVGRWFRGRWLGGGLRGLQAEGEVGDVRDWREWKGWIWGWDRGCRHIPLELCRESYSFFLEDRVVHQTCPDSLVLYNYMLALAPLRMSD